MRYAGVEDRKISTYVALFIIALFAITMGTFILHAIASVNYVETKLAEVLN